MGLVSSRELSTARITGNDHRVPIQYNMGKSGIPEKLEFFLIESHLGDRFKLFASTDPKFRESKANADPLEDDNWIVPSRLSNERKIKIGVATSECVTNQRLVIFTVPQRFLNPLDGSRS
jgi:hypothetical protein